MKFWELTRKQTAGSFCLGSAIAEVFILTCRIGDFISSYGDICSGAPQLSIIGSISCLLCENDLTDMPVGNVYGRRVPDVSSFRLSLVYKQSALIECFQCIRTSHISSSTKTASKRNGHISSEGLFNDKNLV